MNRRSRIALFLSVMATSGCTVGPNYRRPSVPIPAQYRDLGPEKTAQQTESFADLPWWQIFQDPVLQQLIRTALQRNYDLLIAAENINAARAQLGVTRANQFPQITGTVDVAGQSSSQGVPSSKTITPVLDASFQLDLFGSLRRATEAKRAALLSTEEAKRTVVISLVSDVATDYYQLLTLDLELQVAKDTVKAQEESVSLTKLRAEMGVTSDVDVLQAQQTLDSANAQIPDLERQIGKTEDTISILLGSYPQAVPRGRTLTEQTLLPEVPPGLPSSLLERRPDIREAEQTLIENNAEIGVAKANFFPQISLTGDLGRSASLANLTNSVSAWSFAGDLTQYIFTAGALKSKLRLAESNYRNALLSYQQTIQKAFGDVSDALIDYQKYHELRTREEQSVSHLQDALRLGLVRYRGGITTYLEVLDDQRSLFSEQLTLAQTRGKEYQALVSIYKSLGGGWKQ